MLCCTDKKARDLAEATIRESGLLANYEGFGLGAAMLPLEHPTPVRRLSPGGRDHGFVTAGVGSDTCDPTKHSKMDTPDPDKPPPLIIDSLGALAGSSISSNREVVCASSADPWLGRRISCPAGPPKTLHRYATAGVAIKVGGSYYQLTAGHLFTEAMDTPQAESSLTIFDECHFDGQSTDDEHDSDHELEMMGRGSETPEDSLSGGGSPSDTANESNDSYDTSIPSNQPHEFSGLNIRENNVLYTYGTQNYVQTKPTFPYAPGSNPQYVVGYLPQGRPAHPLLDYAMIAIPAEAVKNLGNNINASYLSPPVTAIATAVWNKELEIIVVTNCIIIRGTLMPGKVAYRGSHARQFVGLLQIVLQQELFEGDCGSAVLGASSGRFCGHIVMGVSGTKVAYIVPSPDIFADIVSRTNKPVSIATAGHRHSMTRHIHLGMYGQSGSRFNYSPEMSTTSGAMSTIASLPYSHLGSAAAKRAKSTLLSEAANYQGRTDVVSLDDSNGWVHYLSVEVENIVNGSIKGYIQGVEEVKKSRRETPDI
ncbi:hypothetical protein SAMD00023353_9600320 [Rosellinia necatrix]|uniref:Uncharacterized protein n=1 Tax=Rosellinia necatrix TaxID=77044 RepID=A0A1W2TVL2_ROSNE|nr:hypothetical protein SAMD00023353_9600320 [Rosellinia necatrix]